MQKHPEDVLETLEISNFRLIVSKPAVTATHYKIAAPNSDHRQRTRSEGQAGAQAVSGVTLAPAMNRAIKKERLVLENLHVEQQSS